MKNRIRQLRKEFDLTQAEFGARIRVSPGTITGYELGNRTPGDAIIQSICREYGVSETWLRTGEGEMFPPRSRAEELGALAAGLLADRPDSFRSALITALLRFDPDGPEWSVLERIYHSVADDLRAAPEPSPRGEGGSPKG